jgi:glutaminyl-tRNA synthetase
LTRNPSQKTYIQWVPEESVEAEVRIYDKLFKSSEPMAAEGGFLNDINPNSKTIYPNALIEEGFNDVRRNAPWPATAGESAESGGSESVRFQAIRIGYFVSPAHAQDGESFHDFSC